MDKRDGERGEGIADHSLPGVLRGRKEPPIFYKRHVDTDVTALNHEEWLGQSLLADFSYQPASLYANQLRGRKGTRWRDQGYVPSQNGLEADPLHFPKLSVICSIRKCQLRIGLVDAVV